MKKHINYFITVLKNILITALQQKLDSFVWCIFFYSVSPVETCVSEPWDPPATCPSILDLICAPNTHPRLLLPDPYLLWVPQKMFTLVFFCTMCENKQFVFDISLVCVWLYERPLGCVCACGPLSVCVWRGGGRNGERGTQRERRGEQGDRREGREREGGNMTGRMRSERIPKDAFSHKKRKISSQWLKHLKKSLHQVIRCSEGGCGWSNQRDKGLSWTQALYLWVFLRLRVKPVSVVHSPKPPVLLNLGRLCQGGGLMRGISELSPKKLLKFHCGLSFVWTVVSSAVSFLLFRSLCLLFPFPAVLHWAELQCYIE